MSSSPETPTGLNGTKPGRKPIEGEPKNKRTAQNRAAQRAFRERKEKKMQELEMKVKLLENEKLQMSNESELLRIQVETLLNELNSVKNKNSNNTSNHNRNNSNSNSSPISNISSSFNDTPKSMSDLHSSTSLSTTHSIIDKNNINNNNNVNNLTSNWSVPELSNSESTESSPNNILTSNLDSKKLNSNNYFNDPMDDYKDNYDEPLNDFCSKLNGACGNKTCPVPKDYDYVKNPSNLSSNDISSILANQMISTNTSPSEINTPSSAKNTNNTINNNNNNSSVTNKQRPRQQSFAPDSPMNFLYQSPYENSLVFNNNNNNNNKSSLNDFSNQFSPFDLFNNNNSISQINNNQKSIPNSTNQDFDYNFEDDEQILLNNEFDPIESLLIEEDNKDFFNTDFLEQTTTTTTTTNELTKDNLKSLNDNNTLNNTNDDQVKIGEQPDNLMKCSQVWERITTHPRFSELDIDGLCSELKAKAKCSERGVVINGADLGKVLQNAIVDNSTGSPADKDKKVVNQFLKGLS